MYVRTYARTYVTYYVRTYHAAGVGPSVGLHDLAAVAEDVVRCGAIREHHLVCSEAAAVACAWGASEAEAGTRCRCLRAESAHLIARVDGSMERGRE